MGNYSAKQLGGISIFMGAFLIGIMSLLGFQDNGLMIGSIILIILGFVAFFMGVMKR